MTLYSIALVIASALAPGVAAAATLHVHDGSGVLGTVDSQTGEVDVIGDLGVVLTDIAFDPEGNLFGVSFTQLFSVDKDTAATTLIGSHGVSDGNALVFGEDGTLFAGGGSTTELFTLDTASGAATSLGSTGFASAGDLAFVGDDLFLAASTGDLVSIDLFNLSGSTSVGPFGVGSVFGIATDAEDTLFGVGGTTIFEVDLATGAASNSINFGGQGLGTAFGQSFVTEAGASDPGAVVPPVPLPASGVLLLAALGAIGFREAAQRS